jgi:hypothetical protein
VDLPSDIPRLSGLTPDELHAAILARIEAYPVEGHPDAIVERALAYPFEPPRHSYVLAGRETLPLLDPGTVLLDDEPTPLAEACERLGVSDPGEERHAVLAYGSNGSPAALLRKFARSDEEAARLVIPVLCGRLEGFDVVYSSHLSAYGSVPATIHRAPGVVVDSFVTLLTGPQVVRLMETEFNYEVRVLRRAPFRARHGDRDDLIAFVSRHGALGIDGAPVPLAAIRRSGEPPELAPRSEPDVLTRVRDHLDPAADLREFIVENVRNPRRAVARTAELKRRRIPFAYEHSTVLDA